MGGDSAMTLYTLESEHMLISEVNDPQISEDLYNFVMFIYPWGRPNTPLVNQTGPRNWQRDELDEISEHIRNNQQRIELGLAPLLWKKATASGRGPGKSALVSWLSDWNATCHLGSTTIVSANSETQLKTRTFAEIGKWSSLMLNAHWFDISILAVRPQPWFEKVLKEQLSIDCGYYYVQGQLWSEENPDAFAGVHNPNGVMVNFDEGSGIPIPIWDVTEGFFTEPVLHRYWNAYSNPRKNKGAFADCFDKNKEFWRRRHIDSRTVEGLDLVRFESQVKQHGEDSDFVRVEIRGQFPKTGDKQFISNALVTGAQERTVPDDANAALVMGVDIARFGSADTVLRFRQGRDARSIPPIIIKQRDNMYVANEIAKAIDKYHPDAVNIDAGNGTGVIDRLREMKYRVNEIWFGASSTVPQWANKRTQMYADVRDWLPGGCIDKSPQLFQDLTTPEYDYFGKAQDQIMLQSKEELVDIGYPSPDNGDALALTFAIRVSRRDTRTSRTRSTHVARDMDYPIFG
jgi:hypothetical protein